MQFTIIVSLLISTLCSVTDDPPRPDPDKPVNYAEWINAKYGRDGTENAAEQYDAAAAAYVDDKEALKILSASKDAAWTKHDLEVIRSWIAANEKCLSVFTESTGVRHCYFKLKLSGEQLAESFASRPRPAQRVVRLLAARAKLKLNQGDWRGAVDACAAIRRFAHHMMSQPSLIVYLAGVRATTLCYNVLLEVPRRAAQGADYAALVNEVRKFDRPIRRPVRQLETEKLILWDTIQRFMRDTDADGKLDHLEQAAIKPVTSTSFTAVATDSNSLRVLPSPTRSTF